MPRSAPLTSPAELDDLDFDKLDGLVPVVVQDAATNEVLMLAFADREALARTLETGEMHYHSRSRHELWRKGATSGNTQRLRALHVDCDGDAVLALVDPAGPACHTGARTCFGTSPPESGVLEGLWDILEERARKRPEGSYTVRLLDDPNRRLGKLGEETAELVAALAGQGRERIREEAGDLLYHVLVALLGAGVSLGEVAGTLEARRG